MGLPRVEGESGMIGIDAARRSDVGSWFNMHHTSTHFFVPCKAAEGVMNVAMACRMKSDHRIDIVSAVVSQSIDVVAFKVWTTIPPVKWSRFAAAFTLMTCAVQYMRRNRRRPLERIPRTRTNIGVSATGIDSSLANGLGVAILKFIDLILNLVLAQRVSPNQDENNVWSLSPFKIDHNFMVSIVRPFALEPDSLFLADEEENGSIILLMVAQFVVAISEPGVVVALCSLAVVLIRAVWELPVIVSFVEWIRDYDYGLIYSALRNALLVVATEGLLHFGACLKNSTDVLLPRHCNTTLIVWLVVAKNSFFRVNCSDVGGHL
jgi:hypothetical protein